jgi:DNA-repair protein complementing XP-A cells
MELTEEQKERIQRNRERALEIQRKRKEEGESGESLSSGGKKRLKVEEEEEDVELEDFEVGAPSLVSKKEAMQTYCLPEGTLAVCAFVEKENPRNKKWAPLKLYNRAEIRRRARARFGGLEGLVEERQKREMNRFRKDMETAKNVFK